MNSPRVCYTAGVFDLLHVGHLRFLWRSKALGDVLVVGVVSDAGTAAYKSRRPVQNIQQRMEAVKRLGFVDVVEYQMGTDPTDNLERFRPDVFTHADGNDEWSHLRKQVEALGIEYVNLPYTPDVSTTLLRAKVPA